MCHDIAVEDLEADKGGTEDLKCSGPETEEHLAASRHHMQEGHVPRDDVIEIAVHPSTQDAIQRRRQRQQTKGMGEIETESSEVTGFNTQTI